MANRFLNAYGGGIRRPVPRPLPGAAIPPATILPNGGPRVNATAPAAGGVTPGAKPPSIWDIIKNGAPKAPADPYGLEANNARYNAAMTGAGATGATAEAEGYGRTAAFDPNAAIATYAKGAWDTAVNDPVSGLKRSLADLKGSAVGAGRLDTGFFDKDTGDVINNATRSYQNSLASTAVQGAQMQQNNNAQLLGYGENKTNQYLDLLTGQRDQQEQDARDKAERARKKKRGIGSLIGTVVGGAGGFLLGGPAGAMEGAQMGSQVGGGF